MLYYKLFLHTRRDKKFQLVNVWKYYENKSALLGQGLHVESALCLTTTLPLFKAVGNTAAQYVLQKGLADFTRILMLIT